MTQVATSWLVYRTTKSALLLGLVGFSGQIPALVLAPFAGVWVDRLNLHRVLKVTQTLSMLESFALAALALTGVINIPEIVGLIMFQGAINAFDMPARQSFLIEMVEDRADLTNAIALNSAMFNSARLIGPSIAGLIIALAGEGYCFLIDGFSYLAVIGSLLLMHIGNVRTMRQRRSVVDELKEGWSYVTGSIPIRTILLLLAAVSLMGAPYTVLLPIFAGKILQGGAHTLGFLTGASGVGALVSAIALAMRKTVLGLGKRIAYTTLSFGAGLIFFGLSHYLWLSLVLMLVTGFSLIQQMSCSNTIMQTIVQEDKRGRVMSFYTMAFVGAMPFGSLIAGAVANAIGAPRTVMISGSLCILLGLWFATELPEIRKAVRPIYAELGILPEVAAGVQAASALPTPPE
jgi:MFS family permease